MRTIVRNCAKCGERTQWEYDERSLAKTGEDFGSVVFGKTLEEWGCRPEGRYMWLRCMKCEQVEMEDTTWWKSEG
jgi:hypothetical protein